ncbi:MAG: Eco57I restriction-modification methylase domain-containing protein, partial [Candidatus Hodarchaeales archaeon]
NPPFLDSKRWNYAATARASFEVNYGLLHQAGNADMFAYFIERGIRLLKPSGSFGLIISDKWLDVGFGVGLKQFLLDQTHLCRVEMVDQAIFSAAAVDCVIIFGKRNGAEKNGEKLLTTFIRVPKACDLWNTNGAESSDGISCRIIESSFLSPKKRWGTYLKAPEIYFDILSSSKLEPLESSALIKRGITTGANRFFFLNEEIKASYNISEEFVSPIVDSPRSLKGHIIGDFPLYVLAIPKNISPETLPEGVRQYINEGEKKGFHLRSMIQARKPWYSLPLAQPAPILAAKMMDKTPVFYLNPSGFFANNVFYEITPKKEQILSVWLYLNSTIAHLLIELQGRSYHGGVLEIAAFELKGVPCLSLSELWKFSKITQKIDPFLGPFTQEKRVTVDKMILRILGLEDRYKELNSAVSTLQKYRLTKKRKDEVK